MNSSIIVFRRSLFIGTIVFLTTCSLASRAQLAGDALRFSAGRYYTGAIPLDSIDQCTIEVWVNPSMNVDTIYLCYVGESDTTGFGLYATTLAGAPDEFAEIKLGGVTASATGNQTHLPLNTWTHLALTRSGVIWKLYKNGSLVGRGKRSAKAGTEKLLVGKGFVGAMDEFRVWNRELPQDELRANMSRSLTGNETGLRSYFVMDAKSRVGDSILINKVLGASSFGDIKLVGRGNSPAGIPSTLRLFSTAGPKLLTSQFPSHMQFYSRNANGYSPIQIQGSIDSQIVDSIILTKTKNGKIENRWSIAARYTVYSAPFHFSDSIHSELSQYSYTISIRKDGVERMLAEAADLISGDAFFVDGQSNAHPNIDWYSNVYPYFRTFGIQTSNLNYDPYDPADTSWGYGNAHGFGELFGGPYLVGVWAQKLEGNISYNYGIPTCIINGAAGGSTIEEHIRNDSDKFNLSTVYGRSLYRSQKSGLERSFRAMFWYQGEYNTIDGYYEHFKKLYNAWIQDYGNSMDSNILKRIYVFQIHPTCTGGERSKLRDLQRTLPDSLSQIRVMSTCGVSGHDGCHYDAFGYWHIADNIYRLVARDLYGSTDTVDIDAPNIIRAFYGDSTNDIIVLRFSSARSGLLITPDTLVLGKLQKLSDYFFLDDSNGVVTSISIQGDSVVLHLKSRTNAKHITYLPDNSYAIDKYVVYEGPWILNKRNIGALSFHDFPIHAFVNDTAITREVKQESSRISLSCSPNPCSSKISISYKLMQEGYVEINLIDLLGKSQLLIPKRYRSIGEYQETINLLDVQSGDYFLKLTSGSENLTQKLKVIK